MKDLTEQQKFQQRQSLPLDLKIEMTKKRIREWFDFTDGDMYLAYSGGKDSHVLAEIIQSMGGKYKKIPMVFSNTGLEMPEIVEHVRKQSRENGWNVIEIRPKKTYKEVWEKEGIPLVSKKVARQIRTLKAGPTGNGDTYRLYNEGITSQGHDAPSWKLSQKWRFLIDEDIKTSEKCCDRLKKEPIKTFEKKHDLQGKGMTAMMSDEGGYRAGMTKCNVYNGKTTRSSPMLFWTEEDVWQYITQYNIEICSVYYNRKYKDGELIASDSPFVELPKCENVTEGERISGEKRTGCMFCAFGAHLEKGLNRFQRMDISHPRQHRIVIERMGMGKALDLIGVKYKFEIPVLNVDDQIDAFEDSED